MEQNWCGDTERILEMGLWGLGMEQCWCGDTESTLGMGLWGEGVRDGAELVWGH